MTPANATQCPTESVLADFGLGELDASSAETVSRHIETCAECRQRVAGVTGDSFVGRLKQADNGVQSVKRERTYVPGESLANAANSTDGSSVKEHGLPRPSRTIDDMGGHDGLGRPPHGKNDGLGSPSSPVSAPPELAYHPDYELIKELGQGGMGTVYLAKNRMMDRMEVLKVISKSLLDRPGALERFQQEIRSAAKLAHPNIVAAYSVLRPGDLLVFAMEYVKGQDLSQVVKARGPLPVANAAFYIHQVANGLQHAFEKRMVHRDIKPNNLMLATEGKKHTVKILDFGLAKATSEKGTETGLTKSGQMLGTPDYVAPEQTLNAHQADIRADIYSLGCTLYFLLSGGPPFQEASLYEILEAHHKREPKPLNLVRPEVPVELAAAVANMMAKDPAKRYQTPGEVAKALVPFFKPGQSAAMAPATDTTQPQTAAETEQGRSGVMPAPPITPPPTPFPQPTTAAIQPAATPTIVAQKPSLKRPRSSWMTIAAGVAFVALVLGVIVIIRNRKGEELARVELPDGESVEVRPTRTNSTETPDLSKNASPSKQIEPAPVKSAAETAIGVSEPSNAGAIAERASVDSLSTGGAPPLAVAPFDAKQARAHQEAWAKHLGVQVERTNSIGMKFVLVPPGEFTMGSTLSEMEEALKAISNETYWQECVKSEAPTHKVVLTQPFYLAVHEITQKEYETVMGKNPSYFAKTGPDARRAEQAASIDTARHPVEGVSWNDAAEFCAKLSKLEELKPFYSSAGETVTPLEGTGYRLPTEAEWEFACRAGTTSRFWVGQTDNELLAADWFASNSQGRTHQVEELSGNPFGLFDVHGNVSEWVEDRWETKYYERFADKGAVDPRQPFSAGSQRVVRGGRWWATSSGCRSSARIVSEPWYRYDYFGFRVVLETK
jgi:formylglycine-generating enzyme required for sulfatase activity/serine/threonine protein kinase